tara:strand:- start:1480 stop:1698 length:219 start_codon:yes stop_codon:yes gene_type:complete
VLQLLVAIIFSSLVLIPLTYGVWRLIYTLRSSTAIAGRCRHCGSDLGHFKTPRSCPGCGALHMITQQADARY